MTKHPPQFAVLGSPISHSKSPALHRAAYRVLGLDWEYTAREVGSGELLSFLAATRSRWRGLSLTMPLKREILPLLDEQDPVALQVGAVNTVLFEGDKALGFNTDVYGAERMLREALSATPRRGLVLGGGATARSVAVALVNWGVRELTFMTRNPAASHDMRELGNTLGVAVTVIDFATDPGELDVVVSTLPGDAELSAPLSQTPRSSAPLVDIAYSPWPTTVARHWLDAGGAVVNNGMGMLIYQALAQIRIFVNGNPVMELPDEHRVLAAMRRAVFDTA